MIFSGSVVVDWNNTSGFCAGEGGDRSCLVAVYTGHGHGKQTQNLAYSNDRGRTWTKYANNPVIDLNLENFRDPKAFWDESSAPLGARHGARRAAQGAVLRRRRI